MHNKTILITGAAKRIGAVIAERLHAAGANVIIHFNTSANEAHEFVRRLNNLRHDSAITMQADLKYKEYYTAVVDAALHFKGGIDVLINNASAFYPTPMQSLADADCDTLINTNLKAPLFLSHLTTDSLRKNKGCIINITDIHAYRPLKEHPIYSVAKAGLLMLTKSLAKELAPIRVNAVAPGAITWPDEMDDETKHAILEKTVLKRTGNAEDIAKTIEFLIKDANYITGQLIDVDGGRTIYS